MKTAFKILPEITPDKEYHLLIELGRGGISFTWYTQQPLSIEGMYVYHTHKNTDDSLLAAELQKLLATESLPPYRSVKICYNFKDGMPVPNAWYKEVQREEMLSDVYGWAPHSKYYTAPLPDMEAGYIYRVPQLVDDAMLNRFYGASICHTNACLVAAKMNDGLYCVIYNSYIKCLLLKNGLLQIVQSYDYQTPTDVAYHLLNICRQHALSPGEIEVTLSGFIDRQSSLYEEIYRYFLHVKLDELPSEAMLSEEIKALYPPHFFSYLIHLIQCAS